MMASVIGASAQADENTGEDAIGTDDFGTDDFSNSQNIPVLETSSINPDAKNVNNSNDVNVEGGAISFDSLGVGVGLESVSNGEMTTYIVKEGDTLSEIAQQFDISTNTIKWANNITGNNIKVGQKLDILPVTGVKHVVKKGDTISKIAAKYDAETDDIKVFNGINNDSELKVGDTLYIPNGIIKVSEPVKKPTTPSGNNGSSGSSSTTVSSGYYKWPVAGGRITSPYGSRRGGFHYGVDIGASRGTAVFAAASGVVTETVSYCSEGVTSCGGRYGNYIVVEHSNGTYTRYAHLQKVSVSVGDEVSKGERIGAVGNTGRSTGAHLHFQIEKANGSTIRPKF
jgi:murein DD-endopeptidase MepM/ murein hydrolase activator NlpD